MLQAAPAPGCRGSALLGQLLCCCPACSGIPITGPLTEHAVLLPSFFAGGAGTAWLEAAAAAARPHGFGNAPLQSTEHKFDPHPDLPTCRYASLCSLASFWFACIWPISCDTRVIALMTQQLGKEEQRNSDAATAAATTAPAQRSAVNNAWRHSPRSVVLAARQAQVQAQVGWKRQRVGAS